MKKLILLVIISFSTLSLFAKHIIGGEMLYEYLGKGVKPNTSKYRITLRLFRDQNAPPDAAAMPENVFIGIFDNDNNRQYPAQDKFYDVRKNGEIPITINDFPSCMTRRPNLSYHFASFSMEVELPANTSGYTATYQTCCRITPITNIYNNGSSGAGSTFSCTIPAIPDSSPQFAASIDAVCGDKPFKLLFGAIDADGDSLRYAFEGAYNGGPANGAQNINPQPPPYGSVSYREPLYSSFKPLGANASIDPETGTITGIAPPVGRYVVTVGVTSYRNGIKISTHRKDFIINVSDCDFATAKLLPKAAQCDSNVVSFSNDDFSPQNKTFYWEFADSKNSIIDTSTLPNPLYKFADTGVYKYKLVVNRGESCADSAERTVGVYPGFFPKFNFDGKCINSEVFFTDKSAADYGNVNSWRWDFGVNNVSSDTSLQKHPKFTYTKEGTYVVSVKIQTSMGCVKTITDTIKMIQKPPFSVSNDTLICSIDTLQVFASGKGQVVWTPNYQINNISSFSPLVSPKKTTTYYANYQESRGCDNMDSVVIKVVDYVTLKMPADTTICLTDSITLRPKTDGMYFQWTPSNTTVQSTVKNPVVYPNGNTTYNLLASIGKCNTIGKINVRTVPYPPALAVPDTVLCIGNSVQLQATGGSMYEWKPSVFLDNDKIANPVTSPGKTIQYIVKVNDNLGCPKPGFDTILVRVTVPFVDAGPRDTAVVVDEPLQLQARANGENFLWTPSTGLNDPKIPNPVALITNDQEYIVRVITEGNCIATDTISVKVFNVKPGFYVPNAFTPNNDGLNDIIRPISFGLRSLRYFRIYNRLGEVVFSTNSFKEGWDGTFKGNPQGSAVFAWTAEAVDYTGKRVISKGSITLIR